MASSSSCVGVLALVVVAALLHGAAAENFTVGDSSGWTIPSANPQLYTNWVSGKTFRVGDVLIFRFTTGNHDVARVTKSEYDACTATKPIGSIINTGPASVPLNQTGQHYYICAFSGHCAAGQKLSINVVASGGAPSPTSPTPSSPNTPASGPSVPPSAGGPSGSSPNAGSPGSPNGSPGSSNAAPSLAAGLGFTGIVAALFSAFFL